MACAGANVNELGNCEFACKIVTNHTCAFRYDLRYRENSRICEIHAITSAIVTDACVPVLVSAVCSSALCSE